jgi:hypothetical protein
MEFGQRVQKREMIGINNVFEADPEFENISEQVKSAYRFRLILQKKQEGTIVFIFGVAQVRIGYKEVSHDGHYNEQLSASQGRANHLSFFNEVLLQQKHFCTLLQGGICVVVV